EQLLRIGEYAKEKGIILTAGYGPQKDENLASPDEAVQKNAIEFFKETLRKLHLMNIHILGGGLYSYWPVDFNSDINKERDFETSVKNMRLIAKYAEEYDITLGMEVLNRFEGYLINTCDECLRYIDAVGNNRVGVMLDTFHMNIEEDNIGDAIRKAGDKLVHFHMGERNRKVPGKGTMPWAEIGQALRDIHYQHAAVMEPFVLQGGKVGQDIKIWRNLLPDTSEAKLDADAKHSCEFVRHVFEL
ncbi:D-psicose 3-epimerase, partial [Oribacterium sinus]